MHKSLKNWEARRSGAGISIVGDDVETDERTKLTDIAAIEPINGGVLATDRQGNTHTLLVG